jgi:transposase InsO family protein
MCATLGVSESGYYRHIAAGARPNNRRLSLSVRIRGIIGEFPDNDNYGVPRVTTRLRQLGVDASASTVYRVMRDEGLLHKAVRHPNGITKADAAAQRAANIIRQDFTADAPGEKWLTDITEIPCRDGKLYAAAVLDCFAGEITGLSMDDNMRKELCVRAFRGACARTGAQGMIVHSDRGSQFTSGAFREALSAAGATQSLSGTGRCYDNARMESFFATLKKEKLYKIDTKALPMEEVKTIVFRYVFVYYNRQRVNSMNAGGWPPSVTRANYEARRQQLLLTGNVEAA